MIRILLILAALLAGAVLAGWNAGNCTGWFDGFLVWDWSACCLAHDQDYALGIVKVIADYFLRTCANAVMPGMGEILWTGVAVVGGFISKWFYERARQRRQQPN